MDKIPSHVELLAPVGRWNALDAVLKNGADAVYLAGKQYNMRRHRSDFNFDQGEIARAADKVHACGAKIYVTLNSLLSEKELDEIEDYLVFLESTGVDAVIVQDLGLIGLITTLDLDLTLHSSTMMNVHSPEGAKACAQLGIKRIICSRDITLNQLKEMKRESGIEMEYFVHGDMCIAQGGQCYASGIIFGKSSNRGKCMKPCRWQYDLVDLQNGCSMKTKMEGPHLLAAKDLCLFQFIPEIVDAGVSSLKIEGRMRPPEYLSKVVRIYRTAIDQYLNDPIGYVNDQDLFEELRRERVREFSTCCAFKKPDGSLIGSSGTREPLFLSAAGKEHVIDLINPVVFPLLGGKNEAAGKTMTRPVLAVHAGSADAAQKALEHGADWIYVGGEVSPVRGQRWGLSEIRLAARMAHETGKKVGLLTPRVTLPAQLKEIVWFLEHMDSEKPDAVLVHNLGALHALKNHTDIPLYADFSFNVLNCIAAELLQKQGINQVTLSVEASFQGVKELAEEAILPVECIVHGPLPAMYLEHCIISMTLMKTSSQDPCRGACRYIKYGLKNRSGDVYPVEADQYCRNHILLSKELACLNYINDFSRLGVRSLRIEAQYYGEDMVGLVTQLYAHAIGENQQEKPDGELVERLIAASPGGFSLGAYPGGIFKSFGRKKKASDHFEADATDKVQSK